RSLADPIVLAVAQARCISHFEGRREGLATGSQVSREFAIEPLAEIERKRESTIVPDEDQNVVSAVNEGCAMATACEVSFHALAELGIDIVVEIIRDLSPDLVTAYLHAQ